MCFWRRGWFGTSFIRGVTILVAWLLLIGGATPVVRAEPAVIIDDNLETTATTDGIVGPEEYSGYSVGINSGGGNIIGKDTEFHVDAGGLEEAIHFGLVQKVTSSFSNYIVIYIDSVDGGFESTSPLGDNADSYRTAASGGNVDLFFAPDFAADYAISFTAQQGHLFELNAGGANSLTELASLNPQGDSDSGQFEFDVPMSAVGLTEGGSFKYIATNLHYTGSYRMNEFHGVSQATYDTCCAGEVTVPDDFALQSGDYNLFSTAGTNRVGLGAAEASSVDRGFPFVLWPLLLALLTGSLWWGRGAIRRCLAGTGWLRTLMLQ